MESCEVCYPRQNLGLRFHFLDTIALDKTGIGLASPAADGRPAVDKLLARRNIEARIGFSGRRRSLA